MTPRLHYLRQESWTVAEKFARRSRKSLCPTLSARDATATHEALLTLGKNRTGQTRLITTNFDRLFEHVIGAGLTFRRTVSGPIATSTEESLGRPGLSPRTAPGRFRRRWPRQPCHLERRLRPGLPHRTLGGALRRRTASKFRRVLRWLQYRRPGAALHDGCSGGGSSSWRIHTRNVRLRQLLHTQETCSRR